MATDSTGIKGEVITAAVTDLKKIVTPEMLTRFRQLHDLQLYAGEPDFMAAQWLEDVVTDRQHGLYEHVVFLQKVFEGLATALDKIKSTISGKDSGAANSLAITEINNWINGATTLTIHPAKGKDHYLLNHDGYKDTDTGSNAAYNLYNVDSHGYAITTNGEIVIDTDAHRNGLAAPGVWGQFYGPLITDVNNNNPKDDPNISEDYVMLPETVKIKESGTK